MTLSDRALVLLLAPQPPARSIAAAALAGDDLTVVEASTPGEALETVRGVDVDVVVLCALDTAGERDAGELCRRLRAEASTSSARVLLLACAEAGDDDEDDADQRLLFPCDPIRVSDAVRGLARQAQEARRARSAPRIRRLLIVEDNEDAQWALRDLCELLGHQVDVARDGQAGVELAVTRKPDIALVDIGLPLLDGFEVARRIRARLGAHPLLLVALTGYGSVEQREAAMRAGFDVHLVKPVSADALEVLLAGSAERA